MSEHTRTTVFGASAIVTLALMLYASMSLPAFGEFTGPYTKAVLAEATRLRHVDNVPTAINFDIRGFDTLGEEFIFFTSVAGVLLLFSAAKAAAPPAPEPMEIGDQRANTGAIRWFFAGVTALIAAMGVSVAAHGSLTPGGGFQGGAIFGSAIVCVYLAMGTRAMDVAGNHTFFTALDALGAFSFGAIGVATGLATGSFLGNSLGLGRTGSLVSGGTIYVINGFVFLEIASGFIVLLTAFIKQMRQLQEEQQ